MNKVVGISFSYAENSLQTRGLHLLDELNLFDNIYDMTNFYIPICDSNRCDGNVPKSVNDFVKVLDDADVLVFAISEATGHYSAGFKNVMDWLVVKTKFNAKLGSDYSITGKPIFVITFTPTKYEPNGARHFEMTKQLLEKLGAQVIQSYSINNSWQVIIPKNVQAVQDIYNDIVLFCNQYQPKKIEFNDINDNSEKWLTAYNEWDSKWKV